MWLCVHVFWPAFHFAHSLTHSHIYSIALNPEASFVALLRSRLVDCILWGIFHVLLAYLKRERKPISIFIASRVDMPYKLVYRIPIHCVVLLLTIKKYIYIYKHKWMGLLIFERNVIRSAPMKRTRKKAPSNEQKHSHKYTDNNEVENAKPETGDRTKPRSEPWMNLGQQIVVFLMRDNFSVLSSVAW